MGLSGAEIIEVSEDRVLKVGSERVGDQGAWLDEFPHENLVKVFTVFRTGYVMEKLSFPGDPWDWNPRNTVRMLEEGVWGGEPQFPYDPAHVIAYARRRAQEFWPEVSEILVGGFKALSYKPLTEGMTHGDPTHENIMRRRGTFVLIDPIPANFRSPDVIANDLGKILQSECGWEQVLAGREKVCDPRVEFLDRFSRHDREAARLFAIYHILRTLPYVPVDKLDIVRRVVGGNALRL